MAESNRGKSICQYCRRNHTKLYANNRIGNDTQFQRVAIASFNGVTCNDTSNVITVSVDPLPTASLIGTNTACIGDTVNFTATGGVRYEFFRNGASLGPASATATE